MARILDRIDRPQDLHALSEDELVQVAQEVREHIIDTVGEIGGHFGANLGTCELAVALHSLLDSPTRQDPLGRRPPGLPAQGPHRPPRPAAHDPPVRGPRAVLLDRRSPSTTSWAPATPRPRSATPSASRRRMRLRGEPDAGKVVAVIGDGAMTGGVAFEAIHQAGGLGTPIVVVLNDNGMSIAPNVGALSRYFNRVRLNPKLWHAREGVEHRLTELPGGIGAAFERLGPQLKESIKSFWAPGPVVGGARLGLHRRHRRPRRARPAARAAPGAGRRPARRRPHRHREGQGLRPGRGGRPGGHGDAGTPPSRVDRLRRRRCPSKPASSTGAAAVHAGLRRGDGRARSAATRASSASRRR